MAGTLVIPPPFDLTDAAAIGVAALAGLAVGVERELSGHASGPAQRFAGVRTFFMLGTAAATQLGVLVVATGLGLWVGW